MILGVGVDLVETARFLRPSKAFLQRVFTPAERAYAGKHADPAERLAARFAAKEAVMKALGTGWAKGISWKDIETVGTRLRVRGKTAKIAKSLGIARWHLSISHSGGFAVAVVVAES